MPIRDEIERLKNCRVRALRRTRALLGKWAETHLAQYYHPMARGWHLSRDLEEQISALDKVLSILDEWELVEEGPLLASHFVGDGQWAQFHVRRCSPGDYIAIYKRRGKGDECAI